MPYTKDELDTLPFYQEIARQDESKYIELIQKRTESGNIQDGILRDVNSKNILLFEKITPGQGSDGTSNPVNHTISWNQGYFEYEENDDIDKIIDREFTEF